MSRCGRRQFDLTAAPVSRSYFFFGAAGAAGLATAGFGLAAAQAMNWPVLGSLQGPLGLAAAQEMNLPVLSSLHGPLAGGLQTSILASLPSAAWHLPVLSIIW